MIAITRKVSPAIARCELTHLQRQPIDYEAASRQHWEYEQALAEAGFEVRSLPADPDLPDSVFVEDTALVLGEIAVITRPGAESRRAEAGSIAEALARHRSLARIEPPGTIDGGDIMVIGKKIFVGVSGRTNESGIDQLERITAPHGYEVIPVTVQSCLHLKSAVTPIGTNQLLINDNWIDRHDFPDMAFIETDPSEPAGANALLAAGRLIYSSAYPRTAERLRSARFDVLSVDASELAKAEGAVTCCSLLIL